MSEVEQPQWENDVGLRAVFLGRYHDEQFPNSDLYHAMEHDKWPTVFVRFGNDPWDYASGMVFADNGSVPALVEAKKRAIARGLQVS